MFQIYIKVYRALWNNHRVIVKKYLIKSQEFEKEISILRSCRAFWLCKFLIVIFQYDQSSKHTFNAWCLCNLPKSLHCV